MLGVVDALRSRITAADERCISLVGVQGANEDPELLASAAMIKAAVPDAAGDREGTESLLQDAATLLGRELNGVERLLFDHFGWKPVPASTDAIDDVHARIAATIAISASP